MKIVKNMFNWALRDLEKGNKKVPAIIHRGASSVKEEKKDERLKFQDAHGGLGTVYKNIEDTQEMLKMARAKKNTGSEVLISTLDQKKIEAQILQARAIAAEKKNPLNNTEERFKIVNNGEEKEKLLNGLAKRGKLNEENTEKFLEEGAKVFKDFPKQEQKELRKKLLTDLLNKIRREQASSSGKEPSIYTPYLQ